MAGSRTLKLSILADVDNLKKNLDSGSKEVEGFGGKLEKFSKVAAAAFAAAAAAAAAYAGKLAIEGVKAAIEDEAAQKRLATALKNVTDVTDEQIKSIEEQILQTSLATGVADDQLRPALQRLTVATKDVTKSQDLLQLALDISAATGKDVESVSNALAKAYEGNNGALTRLGIGISAAQAKTLGFEGTVKQLSATFGGSATVQANTFEGQIKRLQIGFDEAKESIGAALLPTLQRLLDYFINTVIPKFQELKKAAVDPIIEAFRNNEEALRDLWSFTKEYIVPIFSGALLTAIKGVGTAVAGVLNIIGSVVSGIKNLVNDAINAINAVIKAYNAIPVLPNVPTIPNIGTGASAGLGNRPLGGGTGGGTVTVPSTPTTPTTPTAPKTPSTGSTAPVGGGGGLSLLSVPSGKAIPSNFDVGAVRAGEAKSDVVINVNAPSVIDEEGFTRAVILALNNSTNRGTTGGGDLRTNAQVL